jgi:DNA polymerase III delta prime subunit
MSDAEGTDGEEAGRPGGREVWIEKYRPQSLDDVLGQEAIVERIEGYITQNELPHLLFSGPAGVGKCVTGETPVLTDRGIERIEDVVGDVKGFDDPPAELEVLTLDGESFEYVRPSDVFGKRAEEFVEIRTRDGSRMTVTPEHRLLVVGNDGFEWKPADDLCAGDRVVRPLRVPTPPTDNQLDWLTAMDGDRTRVRVSDTFAECSDLDGRKVSLSTLRSIDAPRDVLRDGVESIEYVGRGQPGRAIEPVWELTPALARFVGLAISEARIEDSRIKFYNNDEALLAAFEETAWALFGLDADRGTQHGVPYVALRSRTLTAFLEATFDVFRSAARKGGIGSTLIAADDESRRAFLRAVFDAEAHVTENGIVELTQKNGDHITLLSYLLATFAIPSRRTTERKVATNGSGTEREYHTLFISGADHLARFGDAVGFSIQRKARRLAESTARDANPNHDTVPVQRAVDDLCEQLYLSREESLTASLNPETPGRENYLRDVEAVVTAASRRLESAQTVLDRLDALKRDLRSVTAVPATWIAARDGLEPIELRRRVSKQTGIRSDRLLEYSDGRRTPGAARAVELLGELDTGVVATETTTRVQNVLRECIEALDVPYEHVAESTDLRGTEVINLLDGGHDLDSLTRFRTVTDRVRSIATGMLSLDIVGRLDVLERLVESDLYFDEVTGVERIKEAKRVYDLTIPGTHNYVAGTVPTVMHNTTVATAIAREIYGEDWQENFLELNASDERGIDVVRERIKSFARSAFGGYDHRIIFLDEADALCLPPGTEIVAGYPSSPEVRKIETVDEDGEPIPSVDFESNEIQSDEGKLVDSGVADFFEVELAGGRTVLASLKHPFFVVGDDGKLVEKELRELAPGDEIADFRDDVGVTQCEICGDWTAGRFCSIECKLPQFDPAVVSDGGRRAVQTVKVRRIEYSHRGKAYNISMEQTPNFMLANGILTHNTNDAQGALRRTMEQFSANTRFILSCNYSSQIIDPIQSRCAVFRFSPLGDEAIAEQIRRIADAEGIEVTEDGTDALVYAAGGDMRKAINGLQAARSAGVVDEEAVFAITSTARPETIREMVEMALDGDFTAARSRLESLLIDEGIAGGDVIDQLHRSVWEFDLEERATVRVMDRVGEADYRIAAGANERVQLEALLASLALEGQSHED